VTQAGEDIALSIVIPVRDGMPFIIETVAGVLGDPDAPPLELIIRENGSTDGTAEWLATLDDPRVRVVIADPPGSAAENWTAVSRLARAPWVKLLCADDLVRPGGLRRQLDAAMSADDVVMVASRRDVIDRRGHRLIRNYGLRSLIGRHEGRRAARRGLLGGVNPFGEPSAVMFRREALQASLPFIDEFPYLIDLDLYTRVLDQGWFIGLPTTDAAFRVSATSWSSAIGRAQHSDYRRWIRSKHERGDYRLTLPELLLAETMCFGMFAARRVVNTVISARRG
jgi:glycosyltransferase involved in cell wall biosynthesis